MPRSAEENKREQQATDLRYMANPGLWPNWPFLPLKRYVDGGLETCYMLDATGKALSVFHGNMFEAKKEDREQVYPDLRAIQADGWIVD